jgi:hypothetical protein
MKLLQDLIAEHKAPHPVMLVDLTLQEIVKGGGISNPYQLFVLGKMARFFRDGLKSADLQLETPVNFESGETDASLKVEMQKLTNEECVHLAAYLLDCITAGECAVMGEGLDTVGWINYVLRRQK